MQVTVSVKNEDVVLQNYTAAHQLPFLTRKLVYAKRNRFNEMNR